MKRGSLFLESLLAISILAIIVVTTLPVLSFLLKRTQKAKYDAQASYLLQEGMEIAYNVFLVSWSYTPGIYHPETYNNKWVLKTGSENGIQARFNRDIQVYQVCRDNQGNIESPPGTCTGRVDQDSKLIVTTVNWQEDTGLKKVSAELLVINK